MRDAVLLSRAAPTDVVGTVKAILRQARSARRRSAYEVSSSDRCAIDVCASTAYLQLVIFLETRAFTRRVTELLEDDDYGRLQRYLVEHPDAGDVIEGTGGLRKIRVAMAARGKSGGARVIYYHFVAQSHMAMLLIYAKNEKAALTADHRKVLASIIEGWKRNYEQVL